MNEDTQKKLQKIRLLPIAVVHDFLNQYGGAEKVLKVILDLFPNADLFTLQGEKPIEKRIAGEREVYHSFLQKLPRFLKHHNQFLLPMFPVALEELNLKKYKLVISSSGAWSKALITKPDTLHISYCHSPMRFVWEDRKTYLQSRARNFFTRSIGKIYLHRLGMWDVVTSVRPDYIIANSHYTKDRVEKYYKRESVVIYPPVYFLKDEGITENNDLVWESGYYLLVSRLKPYKNIEQVVDAFNKLGKNLVIIGEGPMKKALVKQAKSNVRVLGGVCDSMLKRYYQNAKALIQSSCEDFGLTIAESFFFGKPCIALGKGASLEIVDKDSGVFFDEPLPELIAYAVNQFETRIDKFQAFKLKEKAEKFTRENFENSFIHFIDEKL